MRRFPTEVERRITPDSDAVSGESDLFVRFTLNSRVIQARFVAKTLCRLTNKSCAMAENRVTLSPSVSTQVARITRFASSTEQPTSLAKTTVTDSRRRGCRRQFSGGTT